MWVGRKAKIMVAYVDVDEVRAKKAFEASPNTERFTDYRKMLDKLGKELDADRHQHARPHSLSSRLCSDAVGIARLPGKTAGP